MTTPPKGYTPPPANIDIVFLTCLPVDTGDLPKLSVEVRKPTTTDTLGNCENAACRRQVWIGEKQYHLLKTESLRRVVVLCYLCAVTMAGPGAEVRTLGPDQDAPTRT